MLYSEAGVKNGRIVAQFAVYGVIDWQIVGKRR